MKKLSFLSFFFFLFLFNKNVESKDEIKSLSWSFIEKEGNLKTQIEVVNTESQKVDYYDESFDFEIITGNIISKENIKDDKYITLKTIYYNEEDQKYVINPNLESCESFDLREKRETFLDKMDPPLIITDDLDFNFLGPNILLELLLKYSENVEKRLDTYTLVFEDTEIKLEVDEASKLPTTIHYSKRKDPESKTFDKKMQINYFLFEAKKTKESVVDKNLPFGHACERLPSTIEYPTIKSFYGSVGEVDFESVFKYKNPDKTKKKEFISEIKFNKIYFDKPSSINVIETTDISYGQPLKTVYNTDNNVFSDIFLNENKCYFYNLPLKHNLNWAETQDIFVNYPQFWESSDYNYLGQYNVRNIPCNVFEKSFKDFTEEYKAKISTRNDEYLKVFHPNTNKVFSNNALVTHYYPIDEKYWTDHATEFKIPMKIEIRLFDDDKNLLAKLTYSLTHFTPRIDYAKAFDTSVCAENNYDYNWFMVKFTETSSLIENIKNFQKQIETSYRGVLDISQNRVGEVIIDFDENNLYITTKLVELLFVKSFFHENSKKILKDKAFSELTETEDFCAKKCFYYPDCVAYSYCSNLECRLHFDNTFEEKYNIDYEKNRFDWKTVETEENKNCLVGLKFVKYDQYKHQRNKDFLSNLNKKISEENFLLIVQDQDLEEIVLTADDLLNNIQPGRHSESETEEDILNDDSNHIKYNDYFNIVNNEIKFKKDNLKDNLISFNSGWELHECQLYCINIQACKSFSYCPETKECILTKLGKNGLKEDLIEHDSKSSISAKNYLSLYEEQKKRGLIEEARKSLIFTSTAEFGLDSCAETCKTTDEFECLSFDYCIANVKGVSNFVCFLHDAHPVKHEKKQWTFEKIDCDHYTVKHSTDYIPYSSVKLLSSDLGNHKDVSLDKCASLCTESETCNTFDYCINQNNEKHIESINCRLTTQVYQEKLVKAKEFDCSVFTKINPSISIKKVFKTVDNQVSWWVSTLISILFLFIGFSIGGIICHFVRKYYLISY